MPRKKPKNPPQRPVKPVLPFRVLWDGAAETAPLEPGHEREEVRQALREMVRNLSDGELLAMYEKAREEVQAERET